MQTTAEKYLLKQKLNNSVFHGRSVITLILSLAVVIGVFWWLKLVGITMAGDAFCGKQEHCHNDECYESTLICQIDESEDHTHADACYETNCICKIEPHVHIASCYSDSKSDVETPALWEESVAGAAKGHNIADDLVAVAKTQLGYTESIKNFQVDNNGTKRGYTRYGEWYGSPYSDWSAIFVSFCLNYSNIPTEASPYYSGVSTMYNAWTESGIISAPANYTPKMGDIIFVDNNGDSSPDAVSIVTQFDGTEIKSIGGDIFNKVAETASAADNTSIVAYGDINKILYNMATPEDLARVETANQMIAALPSLEEVGAKLWEYEEAEEWDNYNIYFSEISQSALNAYAYWEDVDKFNPLVENSEKLQYYSSMWQASTLAITNKKTIYQVNNYTAASNSIARKAGATISEALDTTMSFTYWDAFVISITDNGYYVVSTNTADVAKGGNVIEENTFVVLLYNNTWSVNVGDRLEVSFNFAGTTGYNKDGFGFIGITDELPEINNTLTPYKNDVSTMELIEINLYNYGTNINDLYKQDMVAQNGTGVVSGYNINATNAQKLKGLYPGFQQEYGTLSKHIGTSSFYSGSFNFGNNITSDYTAGMNGVTIADPENGSANHHINSTSRDSNNKLANRPVSSSMNFNLMNGYPMLANGISLEYLFSDNAYATKMNRTKNIDGLFVQDKETGKYSFDCRNHHAQYNRVTENFDLYEEIITPNYMMYPFGNFMPFNNINTQSTLVTTINRNYFTELASKATVKGNNGLGQQYTDLSAALTKFVKTMDSVKNSSNWNYKDGVDSYFNKAGVPTGGDTSIFNNMYNIDYDEPSDFYFGMSMHINWLMPKDGMTGPKGDQELFFDFNGDDDVWVYVDNKLFLDLSGIHRHVGGRIDFKNSRVEYYEMNPATGEADKSVDTGLVDENGNPYTYEKPLKDKNGNPTGETVTTYYLPFSVFLGPTAAELINPETGRFYDYSNHSFDFYYMERGSGSSVCRMEFNLPVIQKNSISVTKKLSLKDGESTIGNPDFKFQILTADKNSLFINDGTVYDIIDSATGLQLKDENGNPVTGTVGTNGIFTLKAGQTAVFGNIDENRGSYVVRELLEESISAQYDGQIYVAGSNKTTDHYTGIEIGNETFTGVDSPVISISDGSTSFVFDNNVDDNEYGSLTLNKQFYDYTLGEEPKAATFKILLDGVPIPVGTPYTVFNPNGNTGNYATKAITEEGFVTFLSNEQITFNKVLAGTRISIIEQNAEGYDVVYTPSSDKFTVVNGILEGILPADPVNISVTNDKEGTKLTLPISKTLLYGNGSLQTFSFIAQQVVSPTNLTPHTTGLDSGVSVSFDSIGNETKNFNLTVNFPPSTEPGMYFFRIFEVDGDKGYGKDNTVYVIGVTTNVVEGQVVIENTAYYNLDGTLTPNDLIQFSFQNRTVRSLTLAKYAENTPATAEFTFSISANFSNNALSGSYIATHKDAYNKTTQTTVEFVNGIASVTLKDKETITIHELPINTTWEITELNTEGYAVYTENSDRVRVAGNTVNGTLTDHYTVSYINVGGYELPSTGSYGNLIFTYSGLGMMFLALICGYIMRRRRERRLSR